MTAHVPRGTQLPKQSMGRRILEAIQDVVAVVTLGGILWRAFVRLGEIEAGIVGLLLIGASIGAGVLGFVAGVVVAVREAAARRSWRETQRLDKDAPAPDRPAAGGSNLPVVYTPPTELPARGRRWSLHRVVLWTFIPAIAAAVGGLVLIWDSPNCEGADCEPPRPVVTKTVIATPTPDDADTPRPESSPTDDDDDDPDVTLTPEQAETVTLSEGEVESVLGMSTTGEGGRSSLVDPFEFELCDGEVVSTPDIGNEYSRQVQVGAFDEVGSWVISFQNEGANEIMSDLRDAVATCGTRTRPEHPLYGDEVIRLSMEDENGDSWEVVFFRYRNVLVEVSSVSESGDNGFRVEELAKHAERSLLQVLDEN